MAASKARTIPPVNGFIKQGFEQVFNVFKQNIESGVECGGSFAAYHCGELVVNLWGGFADEESLRPWKHNTAGFFYSTTKSPSAVVIAHLVDRGLLDYDQPISKYWPEFKRNGKEKITLKQLVSLQAGLPVVRDSFKLSLLRDDPEKMGQLLADQSPWQLGKGSHAYSPIVIGLYLDQIVRRVDPQKRGLGEYFRAEISEPFGIDLHIGMPKSEQWRTVRNKVTVRGQQYKDFQMQMAANPNLNIELILNHEKELLDWTKNSVIHDPDFMELPCGSSHGAGSAAGMAKLHGILACGGMLEGRRLLSDEAIRRFQTPLSSGIEKLYGSEMFYSYGMTLLPILEGDKVIYNFGHGGFGGQFAAADTVHKTGWAYVTNYLDPTFMATGKCKWLNLEKALFQCVQNISGVNVSRTHISTAQELQDTLQKLQSKL